MSKASEVAAAFSARLSNISIANGYSTDIGTAVFRGRQTIEQSELPAIVLVEGEDSVLDARPKQSRVKLAQRYIFEGHDACDPLQPNDTAHLILADLKRAIFTEPTFGGMLYELNYIGRNIGVRPDGTAIVAASIEVEAVYSEDLHNP
jgi:hypothetical protein